MDLDTRTAAAVLAVLRVARARGSAAAALACAKTEMPTREQSAGIGRDYQELSGQSSLDHPMTEALALGFLAGLAAPAQQRRALQDVTSFLMDADLVVCAAEGESVLRLPWFDENMFIGRQLPDIREIPKHVRLLAVESYRCALAGDRTHYAFTSYGHSFTVEAVPVCGDGDTTRQVLAVVTPGRAPGSAARVSRQRADRLLRLAELSEQRAHELRARGELGLARAEAQRAETGRQAAERAARTAHRLRLRDAVTEELPHQLTSRELEVLTLASFGCSYAEIAEELVVTPATVKTHLANSYAKLAVPDKAAAVAAALRLGLID